MPAPIPFDAPVTNAIFPSSFLITSISSLRRSSFRQGRLFMTDPPSRCCWLCLSRLLLIPCCFPFDPFQIEYKNRVEEGSRFWNPDLEQRREPPCCRMAPGGSPFCHTISARHRFAHLSKQ